MKSEARVTTTAASRYLVQLCKHWGHKFPVEYTNEEGRVPFASDRTCTFEATPDLLVMRLETADHESLERMQKVVVDHLKRFAFREDLGEVVWTPLPDRTA
jgi:hypothetical protein